MNISLNTNRRRFLLSSAALGGGFALGFALPDNKARAAEAGAPTRVNIWVEIAEDDTVTIRYARSEMGQGSFTSAPAKRTDSVLGSKERSPV